ncbi:MAG: VOC family protein [Candidatus Kariarchaeaceae archaeon]|jgi:catechol-2,3-dioxygenase
MSDKVNHGIHINDLFIWCNNVDEMKMFYSELIGLNEVWYDPEPKTGPPYIVYKLGNNQSLHFIGRSNKIEVNQNWSYQPSSEIESGIEKFSWTLELSKYLLEEIVQRLGENQIQTFQKEITTRSGYSAISVLDPMGNTIDLYYLHK